MFVAVSLILYNAIINRYTNKYINVYCVKIIESCHCVYKHGRTNILYDFILDRERRRG
jgi:hypothetical protein